MLIIGYKSNKNTIENVNRNIRSITKTKGGFTNTNSLMKVIYLKLMDIEKTWKTRTIKKLTTNYKSINSLVSR